MQAPRWNPSMNAASKAKPGPTTSARTTRAASTASTRTTSTVSTRTQRAATAPEAMVVPERHARELAALRTEYEERLESLRTDCQMQLAALATTLRAEHQANIAAVTTTLQQEHQEASAASDANLRQEHSIKETALISELTKLAAQRDASLERAQDDHIASLQAELELTTSNLAHAEHALDQTKRDLATSKATENDNAVLLRDATNTIASKDERIQTLQADLDSHAQDFAGVVDQLEQAHQDLASHQAQERELQDQLDRLQDELTDSLTDRCYATMDHDATIKTMNERLQMLQADVDGHEQRMLLQVSVKDASLVSHQARIDELLGQLAVAKMAAGSAQLLHDATIETKEAALRQLQVDLHERDQLAQTHHGIVDQLQRAVATKDELLAAHEGQVRDLQGQLRVVQAKIEATEAAQVGAARAQATSMQGKDEQMLMLQEDLEGRTNQVAALVRTRDQLQCDVAELQSDVAELQAQIRQLQDDLDDHAQRDQELGRLLEQLEQVQCDLAGNDELLLLAHETQVCDLQAQVDDLQDVVLELDQQLETSEAYTRVLESDAVGSREEVPEVTHRRCDRRTSVYTDAMAGRPVSL
ncbi:hypothetical protein SPRG_20360 [Saprolegnia parasitica CBS 223.65]|uniref:Uncharacterized protein n=1 Tax=Saprolegnia parasitica (strain CBS 223.65) TaxID=695850 RepID=A0A067CLM9_SAPPC|nr:hypothetical protein SPRG_20360 [Saprolegnia parasitica CBS 223.65]KDO27677.1 hypothetical protein SPRG_20360 [Saprolegnia parasitica CBS 223.65]|eukprot:XP_012201596.1 hypothetical protein SPRG_20360 [Saprolegnia parasitica CBS 223.65]